MLHATSRRNSSLAKPRLVIAGATGVLGNEVLRRLAGSSRYATTQVLAREPIRAGARGVLTTVVASDLPAQWPPMAVEVGVVLFDPPRMFFERERALWTPTPTQLVAVARWLRASGAHTLAVVLPHAPGQLPDALKRGLATLDEQALSGLGFDRLLIFRSAQKPTPMRQANVLARLADWMLGIFKYMVPSTEQPVRAVKVAELLDVALQLAPHGIHVAAPETVWQAGQGSTREVAARWLG